METLHIVVEFNITKKQTLLALMLFFVVWHPGLLGSETLTLTTYYPAPYGGYASLLTTGQTLLARDNGTVALGTTTPDGTVKLHVNGLVKIEGGNPGAGKILTSDATGIAAWGESGLACTWQNYTNGNTTGCTAAGYTGAWAVLLARTTSDWDPEPLAQALLAPYSPPSYYPLPSGSVVPASPGRMIPEDGQMLCCKLAP